MVSLEDIREEYKYGNRMKDGTIMGICKSDWVT